MATVTQNFLNVNSNSQLIAGNTTEANANGVAFLQGIGQTQFTNSAGAGGTSTANNNIPNVSLQGSDGAAAVAMRPIVRAPAANPVDGLGGLITVVPVTNCRRTDGSAMVNTQATNVVAQVNSVGSYGVILEGGIVTGSNSTFSFIETIQVPSHYANDGSNVTLGLTGIMALTTGATASVNQVTALAYVKNVLNGSLGANICSTNTLAFPTLGTAGVLTGGGTAGFVLSGSTTGTANFAPSSEIEVKYTMTWAESAGTAMFPQINSSFLF